MLTHDLYLVWRFPNQFDAVRLKRSSNMANRVVPRSYSFWYYDYTSQPTPQPWIPHTGETVRTWDDQMIGSEDKKWREKVASHKDATGAMTATQSWVDAKPVEGNYFFIPTKKNYGCYGHFAASTRLYFVNRDVDLFNNIRDLAVARMFHNARSVMTGFQTGQFTGELRETINLLRRPLSGIRELTDRAYERARRTGLGPFGFKANRKNLGKAAADTWLEWSFGAKPLFGDIAAIAELLQRPMHVYKRVSGRAELFVSPVYHGEVEQAFSSVRSRTYARERMYYSAIARGEVGFSKTGANSRALKDFGLTFGDFVPTVYQLLPYTWLLDYFVNLGDIVEASASGTVPFTWNNVTTRYIGVRELTYRLIDYNVNLVLRGSEPGSVSLKRKYVQRTTYVGSGVPPVAFTVPTSVPRLLNLCSLAVSRFLKFS